MAAMLIVEEHAGGYRIRCAQCAQRDPVVWVVRGPVPVRLIGAVDAAIEHAANQHQNIADLIENRATRIDGDR